MNDQKIVNLLQEEKQVKAFSLLYRSFPKIENLILSKGGSKQDAQDVFQEALIILVRKVKQKDFTLISSLSTYLYSVCRYLWKNETRKRKNDYKKEYHFEALSSEETEIEKLSDEENNFRLAEKVLQDLGKKCLQLLQLFYQHSKSMKQIALKLGYKSESVAKAQKYKCLEHAKLKYKAMSV